MRRLIQAYRYINILSVDVAIGAVCGALFFARLLQVVILPYGLAALGLTVWIIYTCDHLLDAYKLRSPASTQRHQFHQVHFRPLLWVVVAAIVADAVVVYFIRRPVFVGGVFLIFGVAVYLVVQQYIKILKEVVIAALYTAGVLLVSAVITPLPPVEWPWVVIVQFTITAWINLLVFSWYDRENDARDRASSFTTITGEQQTRRLIVCLFVSVTVLTFFSSRLLASALLLLCNAMLLVIFVKPTLFARNECFRLAGDAVFFIPLIYTFA